MPHGMTKVTAPPPPAATTRMPQHQQEEQSSPPSPSPCFYSSRRMKVYNTGRNRTLRNQQNHREVCRSKDNSRQEYQIHQWYAIYLVSLFGLFAIDWSGSTVEPSPFNLRKLGTHKCLPSEPNTRPPG